MMTSNRQAKYYTPPGSYDGLIKIKRQWVRAKELNRIDKTGWVRWQGPPSDRMRKVLQGSVVLGARELFPNLELVGQPQQAF